MAGYSWAQRNVLVPFSTASSIDNKMAKARYLLITPWLLPRNHTMLGWRFLKIERQHIPFRKAENTSQPRMSWVGLTHSSRFRRVHGARPNIPPYGLDNNVYGLKTQRNVCPINRHCWEWQTRDHKGTSLVQISPTLHNSKCHNLAKQRKRGNHTFWATRNLSR